MRGPLALASLVLVVTVGTARAEAPGAWMLSAVTHIHGHLTRPPREAFSPEPRVAVIRFVAERSGRVVTARVEESSGSLVLDQAALAAVRAASPLPELGWLGPGETGDFRLPIRFDGRRPPAAASPPAR